MEKLAEKLIKNNRLELNEYEELLTNRTEEDALLLKEEAVRLRTKYYGNKVFVRGLIEFTNYCKNDCYYCGIRCSNKNADRYRLTKEQIIECCDTGYELGFRTFVLQGGEDSYWTDNILCDIITSIKNKYKDCAITVSIGERSKESYKNIYLAGADRYLLRHETANIKHYEKLHPNNMSYENRMNCLKTLKEIGFQVGCGFMVGSPYQTNKDLSYDLKFIEGFKPAMCGIGPFIPHKDTIFKDEKSGSLDLTLFLLSVIRIICPNVLLPSTTALGTIHPKGREKGILQGANVVMPNLSPTSVRKKYLLYDNKICTGDEAAECKNCMERRMKSIGYEVVVDRGDVVKI